MTKYQIAIGSDHGGINLKRHLIDYLESEGHSVDDVGTYSEDSCDYPVYAKGVVAKILSKECERGILICGSGQGMAMTANRYKDIRAAICSDTFSAHVSREHNDSNVLCIGERVVGKGLAIDICKTWLNAKYEGGRHQKRVELIDQSNFY